jgi:hypothetical protein
VIERYSDPAEAKYLLNKQMRQTRASKNVDDLIRVLFACYVRLKAGHRHCRPQCSLCESSVSEGCSITKTDPQYCIQDTISIYFYGRRLIQPCFLIHARIFFNPSLHIPDPLSHVLFFLHMWRFHDILWWPFQWVLVSSKHIQVLELSKVRRNLVDLVPGDGEYLAGCACEYS